MASCHLGLDPGMFRKCALFVPAPGRSFNCGVTNDPSLYTKVLRIKEGEDDVCNHDAEHDLHEQLRGVLVAQAVFEAGAWEVDMGGRQSGAAWGADMRGLTWGGTDMGG